MVLRRCMVGMAVLIVLSSLLQIIPSPGRGVRAAEPNDPERSTIIVDASGGGDYTRIQWAIDNASDGDKIYVLEGIYRENLVINKTVTLIGNSSENTVVDGGGSGDVIYIVSNWVNISGFNIRNSGSEWWPERDCGIKVNNANHTRIENNNCSSNGGGIYLMESNDSIIKNNGCNSNIVGISLDQSKCNYILLNICNNNGLGIFLYSSDNNSLISNTCKSNKGRGMELFSSENNRVYNNNLFDNSWGILLQNNSNSNLINNNTCNNNWLGIDIVLNSNDNTIDNNSCNNNYDVGIYIETALREIISNNRCNNNSYGIRLYNSSNSRLVDNICSSNGITGIAIYGSNSNNSIIKNTIINNTRYGIEIGRYLIDITNPNNNHIYRNNFIFNNGTQAHDDGSDNEWDDGSIGNYWSDRTTPDTNEDGIVDNPYNLTGNANSQDHFPLTNPISAILIFADAGRDVTTYSHQTVTFDGSNSWGYPSVANYTWSFEYNSTPILLYGPTPSFTFHLPGTYVVTLTVRNDAGDNDTDQMTVNVRESQPPVDFIPPIPNAGPDEIIHQNETFIFNASSSTDNVGIINYTWTFTYDGTNKSLYGTSPHFTFYVPGTYCITLNVSDAHGNWAIDAMILIVRDSTWPIANAGSDIIIDQHELVNFNAKGSSDNVAIVNYTWSFKYRAEEIHLFGPTPSFRFDDAGAYVITLNITDAEEMWDTDTLTITVKDITLPVADAGINMTIDQGERAYFDGSGSSDNVEIVNYTWEFLYDDKEIGLQGWNASFVFDIHGEYDITLTVFDLAGNAASDSFTLTVIRKNDTTPVNDTEKDSDGDGYNDTYENSSGSDPYDKRSTPLDLDGDGWNNTIETQLGSNPSDPLSVPPDMDGDGIPDVLDDDRDGDGSPNWEDAFPDDGERWDEDVEAGGRWLWLVVGIVLVLVVVAGVVAGAVMVGRKKREGEDGEGEEDVDGGGEDEDELGRVGKEVSGEGGDVDGGTNKK